MTMNTAERKINKETVINKNVEYKRIWTFRTQEMMDLFINEMQGQISDGQWENSRNTDWLWSGADIFRLGDKTELKYGGYCWSKKTGYPLTKDLIDCISERIYTENGFTYGDVKALRAAWKEVAEAIKNWKEMSREEKDKYILAPAKRIQKMKENAKLAMIETLRSSNIIKWYNEAKTNIHSYADFTVNDVKMTVGLSDFSYAKQTLKAKVTYNGNEFKATVNAAEFDKKVMEIGRILLNF